MEYYGTLGPACVREDVLTDMIRNGMTGMRLNLSHGSLRERRDWLDQAGRAAAKIGTALQFLIDLEGPELRIGDLPEPLSLEAGTIIPLSRIPLPPSVEGAFAAGDILLLDDGKCRLRVEENLSEARILVGGVLTGRKSLAVPGKNFSLPTLTQRDRENLEIAREAGVTGVMLPFVRRRDDLLRLREALRETGIEDIRIFAKIENLEGVEHLEELIPEADEIVIARGDLGNAMSLWELPGIQKRISETCLRYGRPFMVVTQMLDSMCSRPVPTRAEVLDVYQAVLDGASSVMLTGETAVGRYPAEAMRYLVNTGREAERDRRRREEYAGVFPDKSEK